MTTPEEHTEAVTELFPDATYYSPSTNIGVDLAKIYAGALVGGVVGVFWTNAVINLLTPWKGFK